MNRYPKGSSGSEAAKKAWRTRLGKAYATERKKRDAAIAPLLRRWKRERGYEYPESKYCVVCREEMESTLQKHHIDGDPDNEKNSNLVWLCGSCHNIPNTKISPGKARNEILRRHRD